MKRLVLVIALAGIASNATMASEGCPAPEEWRSGALGADADVDERWNGWSLEAMRATDDDNELAALEAELDRLQHELDLAQDPEAEALGVAAEGYLTEVHKARGARIEALVARGDARSLLAAAMLARSTMAMLADGTAAAYSHLHTAQTVAPNDALTWVTTLALCSGPSTTGCDRAQAAAALTRLEPDNAAFWLEAVNQSPDDADSQRRLLTSTHYDDHYPALAALAHEAYTSVPVPESALPSAALFMSALGDSGEDFDGADMARTMTLFEAMTTTLSTTPFAHHSTLKHVCSRSAVINDDIHRQNCIDLSQIMLDGSTHLLAESIALGRLVELAEGQPDYAMWQQARRASQWRQAQVQQVMADDDFSVADTIALIESSLLQGELKTHDAMLKARGIPRDPPADWTAEDLYVELDNQSGSGYDGGVGERDAQADD